MKYTTAVCAPITTNSKARIFTFLLLRSNFFFGGASPSAPGAAGASAAVFDDITIHLPADYLPAARSTEKMPTSSRASCGRVI